MSDVFSFLNTITIKTREHNEVDLNSTICKKVKHSMSDHKYLHRRN